jgi:predicted cobalt transporter CbtA
MNAEQVNTVGSWCELVGVAFLVRDLMSLARYREKPKRWAAQLKQWAAQVRAWWAATPVMAGGGICLAVHTRRSSPKLAQRLRR